MSANKYIDRICIAIIIIGLIITAMFMNGEALGLSLMTDEDSEAYEDNRFFSDKDQNGSWDSASATVITLEGDSISISGDGAYVLNGDVVIAQSGEYVISGSLSDGSIIVDAYKSSKVWILLNGVDVYCSDDAALRVDQADKVFLTLAEGSENSLESGEPYSEEALDDGTSGTIYAHDDLSINGSGSLSIVSVYRHGIKAKDDLVICGGVINIDAAEDGINVNDSFRMKDADLTISSGGDGIDQDRKGGYFYIESGSLSITSGDDGIRAKGDIAIAGGALELNADDDALQSDGNIYYENTGLPEELGRKEEADSADVTVSSYGSAEWNMDLALSAAALIAGLIFASVFKEILR